jgi:soluble lytic murein transglycosylase-like protein
MNKTLRLAVGVVGFCSIALVGSIWFSPAVPGMSGAIAKAMAQSFPGSRPEVTTTTQPRGIIDDPVAKRRQPKLWTVRTRFDKLIELVSRRHDVDPALVKAMVQAESGFDPTAVSSSGALGLMQVLPETASRFSIEDLSDPHQNLKAGVKYLKYLIELFDGNVIMAVAAYNAGPSRVLRYRGVPPFSETRNYLTKVMELRTAYAGQLQPS